MNTQTATTKEMSAEDWRTPDAVYAWWKANDEQHPFASPNMPEGYCTVPGFFFDLYSYDPYFWDGDVMQAGRGLYEYEKWCATYAKRLGLVVHDTEAPDALKAHGIERLKLFPEALLEIGLNEVR